MAWLLPTCRCSIYFELKIAFLIVRFLNRKMTLYFATRNHRRLWFFGDLQFGLSSCYKRRALKWSLPKLKLPLLFKWSGIQYSNFIMKGLLSKTGLPFSTSLPRALGYYIQSSLFSHWSLFKVPVSSDAEDEILNFKTKKIELFMKDIQCFLIVLQLTGIPHYEHSSFQKFTTC